MPKSSLIVLSLSISSNFPASSDLPVPYFYLRKRRTLKAPLTKYGKAKTCPVRSYSTSYALTNSPLIEIVLLRSPVSRSYCCTSYDSSSSTQSTTRACLSSWVSTIDATRWDVSTFVLLVNYLKWPLYSISRCAAVSSSAASSSRSTNPQRDFVWYCLLRSLLNDPFNPSPVGVPAPPRSEDRAGAMVCRLNSDHSELLSKVPCLCKFASACRRALSVAGW